MLSELLLWTVGLLSYMPNLNAYYVFIEYCSKAECAREALYKSHMSKKANEYKFNTICVLQCLHGRYYITKF